MSDKLGMTQEEIEAFMTDVRMSCGLIKKDVTQLYKNADPRAVRQALLTILHENTQFALEAGISQSDIDQFDKDCGEVFLEYEQEQKVKHK